MKTQKIIYAIMAVTLFFATSCSKDSISDQDPATDKANLETSFLESLELESSSKSNIIFPDSETVENQEYIDFLVGDWKITQFTIAEREGRKSWVNSIGHLRVDEEGIYASIDECLDGSNGIDVFFKVHSFKKIDSGVKGTLKGDDHGGFSHYNRSLGCNTDAFALANGFGYTLNRFGGVEKAENRDIAISIKNNLLVIGDFSKNELIVFKKVK